MNDKLKDRIITAIATGAIVSAGALGIDRANCDYVIPSGDEQICITQEQKDAISSQLEPNKGFGGVTFSGK